MSGWCVFCGAKTTDGRLTCPNCQSERDSLPRKNRAALERLEAHHAARVNLATAWRNLELTVEYHLRAAWRKLLAMEEYCDRCGYKVHSQRVGALHDCNDCGKKMGCSCLPEYGAAARINCPLWRPEGATWTNEDKVRNMTRSELARLLATGGCPTRSKCTDGGCKACWEKWLETEAEE